MSGMIVLCVCVCACVCVRVRTCVHDEPVVFVCFMIEAVDVHVRARSVHALFLVSPRSVASCLL